jgi:Zinc carboxypeptidase
MIKKALLFTFLFIGLIFNVYSQKTPDQFFGLTIGADRTLVSYPGVIDYFKYIAGQSARIKLSEEGKSTLNNTMYVAAISSEENIKQLDQLMAINKKLTNPDTLKEGEAKELLKKAKLFVLVTCTIHATEVGSTQFAMLFAHKMATTDDTDLKSYMDDVVVLLMPSINPDGNILVTEWYQKYLGTEYEGSRMPYLYHHYAGHDNNRDFYMMNLSETRVVNNVLHHKYFPQIFLDMHQMGSTGPRMFVPPFKDPLNQNLSPLMIRETDIIGTFMAFKLQEQGKKGVASSYAFDAYWPGGSKNTAWFKNVVGLLTELASAKTASPIYIEPNELRVRSKGLAEYKAQVNFPDPWKGGWWRLQDIIDYETIAVDALVEISAKNKKSFLTNYYNIGKNNIKLGQTEAPYAYIIPLQQWDEPASFRFLQKMEQHGVRIYKLEKDTQIGATSYKKGDFIIPLAQPYRSFVKVMMERQRYPEIKHMRNGPIMEPYDAAGWTMPMQMGVSSFGINTPLTNVPLVTVKDIQYPGSEISGQGNYYVLPARFNRSVMVVNRLFKKKVAVYRYVETSNNPLVAQGDFMVRQDALSKDQMQELLKGTGVQVPLMQLSDIKGLRLLKAPRVGIYQSYRASMDEGWTRLVLDRFQFSYTPLHNKDFKDKHFARKYDVIIFPDMNRNTIVTGLSNSRWARYGKNLPPQYRGGIGEKGITAIKDLVKEGGTIVLLDSAADLGKKDFSLPFTNVLSDVKSEKFFCPGSLLRIQVDNKDPIAWGMQKDNFIYFSRSPAFRTLMPVMQHIDRRVIASFSNEGPHLLSGYLKGGKYLNRAVTTIRFNYHKGNVIVLGGRVQHRAQTYGTFKFLFNSLYYASLTK